MSKVHWNERHRPKFRTYEEDDKHSGIAREFFADRMPEDLYKVVTDAGYLDDKVHIACYFDNTDDLARHLLAARKSSDEIVVVLHYKLAHEMSPDKINRIIDETEQ